MIIATLLLVAQTATLLHPCPDKDAEPAAAVGGTVKAPKVIRKIEPEFTGQARLAGIPPSILVLALVVPAKGPVCDIRVLSPIGFGLEEAAVEAVRKWEFKPGTRDGKPIAVKATVQTVFSYRGEAPEADEERRTEFNLALARIARNNPKTVREDIQAIEKLSNKKYGPADAYLGLLLYNGDLIPRDYPRAVSLISRANKKNVPFGIYAMGLLLAEGKAMDANPGEALKLMREASYAGVPVAQLWLAKNAQMAGDLAMARKYFRLCAEKIGSCKTELEQLK